jgi:hypothetical protein
MINFWIVVGRHRGDRRWGYALQSKKRPHWALVGFERWKHVWRKLIMNTIILAFLCFFSCLEYNILQLLSKQFAHNLWNDEFKPIQSFLHNVTYIQSSPFYCLPKFWNRFFGVNLLRQCTYQPSECLCNDVTALGVSKSYIRCFHICFGVLFWFCAYFLDIITLCSNLEYVALSNWSHLVFITFWSETDGVIMWRLD